MVWDGADCLICFAGAAATTSDSALAVYSISSNEWTAIQTQGTGPSARTRHTAVLLGSSSMLVFGGCNSAGVFFNDAYQLSLDTWTWTKLQPLSPPPPPRYHHSCHFVHGKVVLYGGVNPKQAFDSVVLLQTSSGVQELSALADELARMTGGSISQPAAASSSAAALLNAAAGGPGDGSPLVGDLMKLQLRDLLVKRNMEELHITAQQQVSRLCWDNHGHGQQVEGVGQW
jgi:N-acetylneuraminic acid mutarotase